MMVFRRVYMCMLSVVFFAFAGQSGLAETVRVRAGEHEGFTRLVIEIGEKTGWQLGRTREGYAFRLARKDVDFDISTIFSRVPRSRLANVTGATDGALALAVSCDCHATAFDAGGGKIVIDIAAGSPAAESPFENPVADDETQVTRAQPLRHPDAVNRHAAPPAGATATLVYRPSQNDTASLPIYWRNMVPDASVIGKKEAVLESGQSLRIETPLPDAGSFKGSSKPGLPRQEERAAVLPPILPLSGDGAPEEIAEPVLPMPLPETGIAATETELRRQLSRAAAQGLIEVETDIVTQPGKPAHSREPEPQQVPAATATGHGTDYPQSRNDGVEGHIAFHAETSMDRDALDNPLEQSITAQGQACPEDKLFDLAHWGDDTPAMAQVAAAREHLTGEFDRPDPEKIARLAQLYLFLGMGAEARQVMAAFDVDTDGASIMMDLALILDDLPVGSASTLHGLRDCDTAASLWSFLAAASAEDVRFVDTLPLVRSFSGLPGHLRYLLGQRLSNRLIEIGAADAARSVRNAVARHAEAGDRVVGMMDARIDLDHGKAEQAEGELDRLATANDALSSQAVIMAIRSRLKRGEVVDPKQVESAAALAFEHRNSPDGQQYAHIEVMARAAAGDFEGAFASYGRWKKEVPGIAREETARELFDLLAARAADAEFLIIYFANRAFLPDAGSDLALQLDLAGRLARLGFAEEVRDVLAGEAALTGRGRMQLARAALDLYQPQEALVALDGLKGNEVLALQAEAYSMSGSHLAAAGALAESGADEAAGEAAWRGGDWGGAAKGPEAMRSAVATLGLAGNRQEPPAKGEVTLQSSKSMLETSAALRQTLNDLLGPPEPAPAPSPANSVADENLVTESQ